MDIFYIGDEGFKLTGKETVVSLNLASPIEADIVIGNEARKLENTLVISGPGEYEVKGTSVFGFKYGYFIEIDGVRVFYTASKESFLTDDALSDIGEVDVLLIPSSEVSDETARKIGASVVVVYGEGAHEFISKKGLQVEPLPKLSVKAGTFLSDEQRFVLLTKK